VKRWLGPCAVGPRLAVAALAALLASACASAPTVTPLTVKVTLPPTAPGTALTPARVAATIDARPEALREDARPHVASRYGVLAMGAGFAYVAGARVEGPTFRAESNLVLAGPDGALRPTQLVDAVVSRLLGGADAAAGSVALGDVADVPRALGVRDGVVVVPILDQLDVATLSSRNDISGGASYESARGPTTVTTTTTAGAAHLSSGTATYANVRVRLLVLSVRAGAIADGAWIYGRGHGPDLDGAIAAMASDLALGLRARSAPRGAPTSPLAPPDAPSESVAPPSIPPDATSTGAQP
jgi:hypothetical protein